MGGYLQYQDDDEQRPRFAPVSPLGPSMAPGGPVPVTPPAMAPRGIAVQPPQQLPMVPQVHTTTDRQALGPVQAPMPNVSRETPQPVQPPAPNAGMPTGWRRGLGALAVGLGAFKSPQLGESIEREVFDAPHERAEQQYEQQAAQQQREQAAQRQSGLDVTEKGLKEAQTKEATATAGEKDREPESRVSQQFRAPVPADGGAWVETAPNKWEFQPMGGKNPAKPSPEDIKVGTVNGKQVYGVRAPDRNGWIDSNTGQPLTNFIPNEPYGQTPMFHEVVVVGPDGNPRTALLNSRSGEIHNANTPGGGELLAPGAIGGQQYQASVIGNAGKNLLDDIAANKTKFGDIQGIMNSAFLNTPIADPTSARLAAEISSFAALQPKLHGFRGQEAMHEFEKMIGGFPKDPEALAQAITGLMNTARIVQGGNQSAQPSGAVPSVTSPEDWLKNHRGK